MPVVVRHRGAAAHAPENTLEGLRLAAQQGVGAIEVDVTLSQDGVPVLVHDSRLERTTNGTGRVFDHSLAALRELDAGAWFETRFAGARIPTLAEALELCLALGLAANLEIKPASGQDEATATAAVRAVRDRWPPSGPTLLFSSFSAVSLARLQAVAPDWPRAASFRRGRVSAWLALALARGCVAVHARADRLTPDRVAAIRRADLYCGGYTVNAAAKARRLVSAGVSYLFSDRPAEIEASLSG